MSECNIRLQGYTGKGYTRSPNSLLYDYRVSDKAVRLYDILLDLQFKGRSVTQEYLAQKLIDKDGKAVNVRTIIRLMNELKKHGWLCMNKQRVYNKETGEVKTIAEYVLFWQSASAPKSNTQLLQEQAAELEEEQAELEEYDGYQTSIGGGFDNLQAELEEQIATGELAPIPIPQVTQEQAAEVAAVPSELQDMIAWAEAKLGHEFSEFYKQAIAKVYASDKAGARDVLNVIVSRELAAR